MATRVDAFWGFDSFIGMPNETFTATAREAKVDKSFPAGMFDLSASLDKGMTPVQMVNAFVNDSRVTLLQGWFDKVLTRGLASQYGMKPAFYVDIDCDIYSSSITALRWLLQNDLILPGTYVGYDDWGYGATTDVARREFREPVSGDKTKLSGEPRAHAEVTREFGLTWRVVLNFKAKYVVFQLLTRKPAERGWRGPVASGRFGWLGRK